MDFEQGKEIRSREQMEKSRIANTWQYKMSERRKTRQTEKVDENGNH